MCELNLFCKTKPVLDNKTADKLIQYCGKYVVTEKLPMQEKMHG